MKKSIIVVCIVVVIFLIVLGIYVYLNINREIKIYEEYEVYSERKTWGMAWHIIDSEDVRISLMDKLNIKIPQVDFSKHYLLWSDGRRVKKITYKISSKFKWQFDVPKGVEVFGEKHYPHTSFIYKINRVYVKQEGD